MSVDRTFSFKSGEKSCTSSCAKYKWENTYHAWFMVMWWQQMKPQIVSVPMVVPACFLSCLCSTTTLDLWNYCKGNSGSPNVHTPRSASHTRVTRCQHLSDGFRRLESVEMWLSYRSLPSLLSLLFPRGPEHMYPAWFLGVLLVWRCLRHLFGRRAAGGPPTDVGRQSISRTFSVWLTWDAGFGEEGAEAKCHLMTSSWEDTLSARFISVSDDHGHVTEVSPGFIATCFSFLFFSFCLSFVTLVFYTLEIFRSSPTPPPGIESTVLDIPGRYSTAEPLLQSLTGEFQPEVLSLSHALALHCMIIGRCSACSAYEPLLKPLHYGSVGGHSTTEPYSYPLIGGF